MVSGNPNAEDTLRIFVEGAGNSRDGMEAVADLPIGGVTANLMACEDGSVFLDPHLLENGGGKTILPMGRDGRIEYPTRYVRNLLWKISGYRPDDAHEGFKSLASYLLPALVFLQGNAFEQCCDRFQDLVIPIWPDLELLARDQPGDAIELGGVRIKDADDETVFYLLEDKPRIRVVVVQAEVVTLQFMTQCKRLGIDVVAENCPGNHQADYLSRLGVRVLITSTPKALLDQPFIELH